MSILDRGRNINSDEIAKELVTAINNFYKDDNITQKTDLSNFQIIKMAKIDYRVHIEKELYGYQSVMDEYAVKAIERRNVSHDRQGRTEGLSALSTILQYVVNNSKNMLQKMFGAS
jgi:hypothetical protein